MSLGEEIRAGEADPLAARYSADEAYYNGRGGAASDWNQQLRASMFVDLAQPGYSILDFGCGNGGVLQRLPAARRVGVEIGKTAAAAAAAAGIEVVASLIEIPSQSIDLGISFHALEHVGAPLGILLELRRVMRPGARIRLVVPAEISFHASQRRWQPNHAMHVYAWTPLSFGNLVAVAGFNDIRSRLAPPPSGSRLLWVVRYVPPLRRTLLWLLAYRRNALNIVLDAVAPELPTPRLP
jgi:SAM-dependent methyltransferase